MRARPPASRRTRSRSGSTGPGSSTSKRGRSPRPGARSRSCAATTAPSPRASRSARPARCSAGADGIVDFDTSRCIGCKACLQACPYDAIYIDPEEHVAEKCNFCAHRVDRGLLPACVVVCPTESLIFGDLDDPGSRASRLVSNRPTTVRRPEQGTGPKAFYLGASDAALDPLVPVHADQLHVERPAHGEARRTTRPRPPAGGRRRRGRHPGDGRDEWCGGSLGSGAVADAQPRRPGAHGLKGPGCREPPRRHPRPDRRGIGVGATGGGRTGNPAAALRMPKARVAYDVFHPRPWGWKVALYLWTKGIGAGAFGLVFLAASLGLPPRASSSAWPPRSSRSPASVSPRSCSCGTSSARSGS